MAKAPYGAVYATPALLRAGTHRGATEPLEPFPVKGKTELIQAYAVGGASVCGRLTSDGDLPMTGRAKTSDARGSCALWVAALAGWRPHDHQERGARQEHGPAVTEALREWAGGSIEVRWWGGGK